MRCVMLFSSGAGSMMLLAAGVLDVLFAAFFAYVVYVSRTGQPAVTRSNQLFSPRSTASHSAR
jgi:hypothetical protein